MSDLKVGESGSFEAMVLKEQEAERNAQQLVAYDAEELAAKHREQNRLHAQQLVAYSSRAYDAEELAAKLREQNRLLGERLHRLEALVQSSFARSVRTLSSSRGQLGRSVEADKVVQLVEEHLEVTRFLDEQQVPGDKLLQRVRWLHEKATRMIVQEPSEFFMGVDPGFPGADHTVVVEVRGEEVSVSGVVLFRCKKQKPGDGGFVDGCGWQGHGVAFVCCPACGSLHVRRST